MFQEDILLLIQCALVRLGSASHSITTEHHMLYSLDKNEPQTKKPGHTKKGYRAVGQDFLEKTSKKLEVEKILAKVKTVPSSCQ